MRVGKNSRRAIPDSMKTICVFCGSRLGYNPEYEKIVIALATDIARRDLQLVYGGGSVGLMGKLADTALDEGGKVIGVAMHGLRHQVRRCRADDDEVGRA